MVSDLIEDMPLNGFVCSVALQHSQVKCKCIPALLLICKETLAS